MKRWEIGCLVLAVFLLTTAASGQAPEIEEEDLDERVAPEALAPPEAAPGESEIALPEPTGSPIDELESLAEQKYLEGDLETASQLYQQLSELSATPERRTRFLVLAAFLEHQLDKAWKAKALLTQALVIDLDLAFPAENYSQEFVDLYHEGRALAEQELRARTAETIRLALDAINRDDLAAARGLLVDALTRVPDEPFALYNLALVEQREGDKEKATAGYERLFALEAAKPGTLTPELREQASLNLGMLYFSRGFMEDAISYLQAALLLDPSHARAWNTMGLAHDRLKETQAAERSFRKALELESDNPRYANNLATLLLTGQRWMEAVALLLETSRLHPGDAPTWINLGIGRRGMQNLEGAADSFARALDADPEGASTDSLRAARLLLPVEYRLDRFLETIATGDRILARDPEAVEAWVYKGLAEKAVGDQAAARSSLERAAELAPDRADIHNNVGSVLVILGEHEAAGASFRRALELDPELAEARENLAKVDEYLERQRYAGAQPGQIRGKKTPASNRRPLGVEFSEVDYGELGINGVLVGSVRVGEPGFRAGLRSGDMIVRVDGFKVATPNELVTYIYQKAPSSKVKLDLLRKGRPLQVTLDLR